MSICCVQGCDDKDSDGAAYFTFPVKPALRKKWRAAIPTSEKLHDDSKVCAHHFRETDYEWVRGKLRLKSGVVPCIFSRDTDKTVSDEATVVPQTTKTNNENCEPEALPEAETEPLPETPDFMTLADFACMQREDESAENCTIECVPEAILNHESDSHSETELHKEDIENIIANYHIKQNKELAERLKASEELDREKQKEYLLKKEYGAERSTQNGATNTRNGGNSLQNGGNGGGKCSRVGGKHSERVSRIRNESRSARSSQDSDCILTEEPTPHFVEISVDKGDKDNGDCMMLLESVQVDVDPSSLLQDYHPLLDDEPSKEEAISLLTSSDSDDVILQEPHIDTVEVSSSDSDSTPLVRLVAEKMRRLYPCFECRFTTYSLNHYKRHRLTHTRPNPLVCSCGAEVDSKAALRRHERTHRKHECNLCDFQARHNAALVYHMQSHGVAVQTVRVSDGCMMIDDVKKSKTRKKLKQKKRYKCGKCPFVASHRRDLDAHRAELH